MSMNMNIVVISVLFVLAFFGIVSIVSKCSSLIVNTSESRQGNIYLVMTVKNRQDDIEGTVRSLVWRIVSKNNTIAKELIIVDEGSEDDTLKILSRLEKEYDFLHIMTKESYMDMLRRNSIGDKL